VLNGNVDMLPLTGEPGQGWSRIECPSKKAYGCGKSMEAAVQDLTLYVRLGDDPLVTCGSPRRSLMREALAARSFPRFFPRGPHPQDQDLIVIGLSFVGKGCPDALFYFLLYTTASTRHCP
jgi:hypothetical protein